MTASGIHAASMSSTAVSASGTTNPEASSSSSSPRKPSHHQAAAAPAVQTHENQATTRPHDVEPQPRAAASRPAVASQRSRSQVTSSPGNASEIVGDYALGETIGKGTFGKVKLGLHLPTGEKVAVKILEKRRIVEVADVERVAREIKILKRNRHVNVIQLFEVIDSPERIFLIMEYVDSGEMFEYIVAHHRIREPDAVVLFQQIVDGLEYLHANEVTHRDLKPENLLLQSCPAMPTGLLVKIVDFGLSNTHDGGRLLRTACGSPCYAAPEMIQGKLYKGPIADVWSLGVVLFAMVCGYLPYEDSNTNMLYKKILSADYKLPPFLSHAVQDLIRRIFETNPEKRLTTEMIRQHPWLAGARPIPRSVATAAKYDDARLRAHILGQLATVGMDPDDVASALQLKAHNNLTAAFYLLYNKLLSVTKEQAPSAASQSHSQQPPPARASPPVQLAPSDKSDGTPRRPEITADEVRSTGIRTKEMVPVKAPSSASVISPSPLANDAVSAQRRRASDLPASQAAASVSVRHHVVVAAAPSPMATQPQPARRPSSVRSGRNLVLLTNGVHTPAASGASSSAAPQRPQTPAALSASSTAARPPSQGGGGGGGHPSHSTRVSVSNGMVALTPLFPQHQHSQRRPDAPSGASRRHLGAEIKTLPVSAASPAASASQAVMRRRGTPTAAATSQAAAPVGVLTVVQTPQPPPLKEDDARPAATEPRRIPPHRPQPPTASSPATPPFTPVL